MKKSVKYMTVTTAAAVMLVGSISVSYAANIKCPNCGYLLTGSTTTNTPGTPSTTPAVKKGWVETTVDRQTVWNYYDNNGTMLKNQWFCSPTSGIWYYLDRDGAMVTGWGEGAVEGYWFDSSGAMATGWREITLEEEKSYGPSAGASEKGYFYFSSSGKVCEGWTRLGDKWYYLNDGYAYNDKHDFANYQMVYGEAEIDGNQYYFGEANDGSMKTGLVKVISETNSGTPSSKSTESYYLYNDGGIRVLEGWGKYNNTWYFVDDEKIVTEEFVALDKYGERTDINEDDVTVYYMNKDGVMVTGWLEMSESQTVRPGVSSGKTMYYFNNSGVMVTGWRNDGNKWYYLMPKKDDTYEKGQMVSGGLVDIGDDTYYFNTGGDMVSSAWKAIRSGAQDINYYFGSDGKMIKAAEGEYLLIKVGSRNYIVDEKGARLTGTSVYTTGDNKLTIKESEAADKKDMYVINNSGVATRRTYTKPATN